MPGRRAEAPRQRRAAMRAGAECIEFVARHGVPVALDQRLAAARAGRAAALAVVHVAGVDMRQAVGQRDAAP